MNKSDIMKLAWQLARTAAKTHGGSSKQYLSETMKIAWGSSKQLKQANNFDMNIDYTEDADTIFESYYYDRLLDHKKATDNEISQRLDFVMKWREWFTVCVLEKSKAIYHGIPRFLLDAYGSSKQELLALNHELDTRNGIIDQDLEDLLSF